MKIHAINLGRLRNEEMYQFQTDLHSLLKNSEPVKTGLGDALYGEFNRLRAAADAALQPARKSALTPILAAEDAQRDQLYGALRDLATLYAQRHYEANKRPVAAQLLVTLDKYKRDIATGTYNEETAAITNLVEDLQSATVAAPQVNTLGLNAWVEALANINNQFVTDLAARYAETAAQPAAGAMRDLRPAIEQNLRALFEKVNALLLTAPDAAAATVIDTFIAALNARIDYYARAAARHGKRKTPGDQPSGAPDAGDDADASDVPAPGNGTGNTGGSGVGAGNGEAEITIPVPLEVDVTATARAKKA
ncbi:MAG: DUF6261 family protein [Opitutaceae bacterium]|jgi:hypothetical protein|nr:DUF6261 family protein [Opitutaceae bacterium]